MDAFSRSECLPNTRQDVLTFIIDWLTTPSEEENIIWLHGLAGSGKSTLATTIAEYFRDLGRLGAFLFFDRNSATRSEPAAVIRTLSYQLARFEPSIKAAICAEIESDPSITEASMRVQFAKLFLEPLACVTALPVRGPIIIVVDALDECGNATSRNDLLSLLAQELTKLPTPFRFLFTSRRDFDIEVAFGGQSNIVARELDTMSQNNTADISSYLHHHMAVIRACQMFGLPTDWPGEANIEALVQYSGGLFIWASTAVKFIMDGHHPEPQLNILLRSQSHRGAESALDALYGTALETALKWDSDEVTHDFRAVLGAIVVGRVPLSDDSLDLMLGLGGHRSSRFILSRLLCLLHWTPGQLVQTLHASFVDYLSDPDRCKNHPWFIDVPAYHEIFTLACFRHMEAGLRFNICELETSHIFNDGVPNLDARIKDCIPDHLSYACRFWADHLRGANRDSASGTLVYLKDFLYTRLLHWLEVLSLVKEISIASRILKSTVDWSKVG